MTVIKICSELIFKEYHEQKKVKAGFVIKQGKYKLHLNLRSGNMIIDMRDHSSPVSIQEAVEREISVLNLLVA